MDLDLLQLLACLIHCNEETVVIIFVIALFIVIIILLVKQMRGYLIYKKVYSTSSS